MPDEKTKEAEREFAEHDEQSIRQIALCHDFMATRDVVEMVKHAIKYGRLQGARKERKNNDFPHIQFMLGVQPNRTYLYEALLRGKKLRDEQNKDKAAAADRLAKLTGDSCAKKHPDTRRIDTLSAIAELHSTAEILSFYNTRSSFSVYHEDERLAAVKFFNRAVMRCIAVHVDYERELHNHSYNLEIK